MGDRPSITHNYAVQLKLLRTTITILPRILQSPLYLCYVYFGDFALGD